MKQVNNERQAKCLGRFFYELRSVQNVPLKLIRNKPWVTVQRVREVLHKRTKKMEITENTFQAYRTTKKENSTEVLGR